MKSSGALFLTWPCKNREIDDIFNTLLAMSIHSTLKNNLLSVKKTRYYHKIKEILSVGITVIIVIVLALYIWKHQEVFRIIGTIKWPFMGCIALIWIVNMLVGGLKNKVFLQLFGVELSFKEWFGLRIVSLMTNHLIPFQGAGMTTNAVYLKKRHRFSYSGFTSIAMAHYHLSFLVSSSLGVLVVGGIYLKHNVFMLNMCILFLSILFGILIGILIIPKLLASVSSTQNSFLKILKTSLEGWQRIRSDRELILKMTLLILMVLLIQALRFYVGYKALSLNVSVLPLLLLAIVNEYSSLIRITPGNLGIRETVIALVSKVIGIGFDEGLVLGAILRGVNMIMIFILGPLFSYLLTRELAHRGDND